MDPSPERALADELIRELRIVANAGDLPPKGHPNLARRAADEIERLLATPLPGALRKVESNLRAIIVRCHTLHDGWGTRPISALAKEALAALSLSREG